MPEPLSPLSYRQRDDLALHKALTQAAREYLNERGDHRFADGWMIAKMLLIIVICGGAYWVSLWQQNAWLFALSYAVFIVSSMFLAINAVHDASHNAFFKQAWANRLLNRLITVPLGLDPDCWRVRHVIFHHAHINVEGYDLDIEENGVLRQTPFQRWKPFMRMQRFYWPLVAAMTFPYIIWVFDWQDRAGMTRVAHKMSRSGAQGWGIFLFTKLMHVLIALVIPIAICQSMGIGWGTVLLVYLLSQMFSSFLFVMLILGTHWAKAKFYQAPEEGGLPHGWYYHVFSTSFDWYTTPRWFGYWLGGINLHLTHHLFPNWSHRHYPALAQIIADTVAKHGMEYHSLSLSELLASQQRFLKDMGMGSGLWRKKPNSD